MFHRIKIYLYNFLYHKYGTKFLVKWLNLPVYNIPNNRLNEFGRICDISFVHYYFNLNKEVTSWLDKNVKGWYRYEYHETLKLNNGTIDIVFENKSDLMFFKLKWS